MHELLKVNAKPSKPSHLSVSDFSGCVDNAGVLGFCWGAVAGSDEVGWRPVFVGVEQVAVKVKRFGVLGFLGSWGPGFRVLGCRFIVLWCGFAKLGFLGLGASRFASKVFGFRVEGLGV